MVNYDLYYRIDNEFNVFLETEKIDISNIIGLYLIQKIFSRKNTFNLFKSNFDYERIQSLFSAEPSISILELIN